MSNISRSTREAVAVALGATREQDLIEGVKAAVISELESLDPTVKIRSTEYFNHSFAPDLELTWPDDKHANRHVFLRYSLASAAASMDFRSLGPLGAVVLALRQDDEDHARVTREVFESSTTDLTELLATEVGALDQIGPGVTSEAASESAPLLDLVRGNLVRGARGLVTTEDTQILGTYAAATSISDPRAQAEELERFQDVVAEVFVPDAAARLTRAAQLLQTALGPDVVFDRAAARVQIGGILSRLELRALIPFLLSNAAVGRYATPFWQTLGGMIKLEGLEAMYDALQDIDLTPLVRANIDAWQAKSAQVAMNVEFLEREPSEEATDTESEIDSPQAGASPDGWRFEHKRLCLILGSLRTSFTTDNRALKGRSDSRPARWDEIAQPLSSFDLLSVRLDGLERRLQVAAESSANVYRDVTTIRSSLPDDFHVPTVEVRAQQANAVPLSVDFTSMIAAPNRGSGSLRELADAAVTLLGYRDAIPRETLLNYL